MQNKYCNDRKTKKCKHVLYVNKCLHFHIKGCNNETNNYLLNV